MKKNRLWILLFLLPSIALFLLIFGVSVSILFGSSFLNWRLAEKVSFAGLNNFINLTKDARFIKSFSNTAIWVIIFSPIHVAIGITCALILSKKQFYWKFVRTVYMFPNIVSSAALAMLFLAIFNSQIGFVNSFIRLLGFKDFAQNWFFDYTTAFGTLTATFIPFAAVITILILAEIAAIPDSVLESATIDGANEFQRNIYVVLPLLRNVIGTCLIITMASFLKNFDFIFMTTNGGPGDTTMSVPLYLYNTAMIDNNYGYANAIGTFLVILGILVLVLITRIFRMGESDI